MLYKTKSYRIFSIVNYCLLTILGILSIIPIVHILAISLSSRGPAEAHLVRFWPEGFTFDAYLRTLESNRFILAFWNGLVRTVLGTLISMCLITPAAFALSQTEIEFRGRNIYMWFFLFAMLFSGGLVPLYILIVKLKLINSMWALILPGAINVWNMILLMNFFRTSVPSVLKEAAMMDGANYFQVLLKIYLPISTPALATIALFTMVANWNSWFDGLIFMTDTANYPLATFLQTIIVQQNFSTLQLTQDIANLTNRTVKAAQIFIAMLPVLIAYPYLQKYFVKGIVLGSIKE